MCRFNIEPGEMAAVVGYTGSGKSTLLKLIAGIFGIGRRPVRYCWMAWICASSMPMELRRSLAYVPQKSNVPWHHYPEHAPQ